MSNLTRLKLKQQIRKMKQANPELPVLQTVQKNYTRAVDYLTYRLDNHFSNYHDTVSWYIAKLMNKVKWLMTAYFFHLKDPISITGFFLEMFKLACNTNIS